MSTTRLQPEAKPPQKNTAPKTAVFTQYNEITAPNMLKTEWHSAFSAGPSWQKKKLFFRRALKQKSAMEEENTPLPHTEFEEMNAAFGVYYSAPIEGANNEGLVTDPSSQGQVPPEAQHAGMNALSRDPDRMEDEGGPLWSSPSDSLSDYAEGDAFFLPSQEHGFEAPDVLENPSPRSVTPPSRNGDAPADRKKIARASPTTTLTSEHLSSVLKRMARVKEQSRRNGATGSGHHSRLRQRAELYGLEEVRGLDASGDCFFDALADQLDFLRATWRTLGDRRLTKEEVRSEIVSWLKQNGRKPQYEYAKFIEALEEYEHNFDVYIAKMSKSTHWADFAMVQAACDCFSINIVVIGSLEDDGSSGFILNHLPQGRKLSDGLPCAWLGHVFDFHFQSLRPARDIERRRGQDADQELASPDSSNKFLTISGDCVDDFKDGMGHLVTLARSWSFSVHCPLSMGGNVANVTFELLSLGKNKKFSASNSLPDSAFSQENKSLESSCVTWSIKASKSDRIPPFSDSSLKKIQFSNKSKCLTLYKIRATSGDRVLETRPLLLVGNDRRYSNPEEWPPTFGKMAKTSFQLIGLRSPLILDQRLDYDGEEEDAHKEQTRKRGVDSLDRQEASRALKKNKDDTLSDGIAVLVQAFVTIVGNYVASRTIEQESLESLLEMLQEYCVRSFGSSKFKRVGDIAYWYRKLDEGDIFRPGEVVALVILHSEDQRCTGDGSHLRVTARPSSDMQVFAWTVVADEFGSHGGPKPFSQKGDPDGLRGVATSGAGGTGCVLVVFMGHVRICAHPDVRAGDSLFGVSEGPLVSNQRRAFRTGMRGSCFGVAVSSYDPDDHSVMGLVWTLRQGVLPNADDEGLVRPNDLLATVSDMVDDRVLLRLGGVHDEMKLTSLNLKCVQDAILERLSTLEERVSVLEKQFSSLTLAERLVAGGNHHPFAFSLFDLESVIRHCQWQLCDRNNVLIDVDSPWETSEMLSRHEILNMLEDSEVALEKLSRIEECVKKGLVLEVDAKVFRRAKSALFEARKVLEQHARYFTVLLLRRQLLASYSSYPATDDMLSNALVPGREFRLASGSKKWRGKTQALEMLLGEREAEAKGAVVHSLPGGGASTMLEMFCQHWAHGKGSTADARWPLAILLSATRCPGVMPEVECAPSLEEVLAHTWFDGHIDRSRRILEWANCEQSGSGTIRPRILWLIDQDFNFLCSSSSHTPSALSYGSTAVINPLLGVHSRQLPLSREFTLAAWDRTLIDLFVVRFFPSTARGMRARTLITDLLDSDEQLVQLFSRPALLKVLCDAVKVDCDTNDSDSQRVLFSSDYRNDPGSTSDPLSASILLSVLDVLVGRSIGKVLHGPLQLDCTAGRESIWECCSFLAQRSVEERVLSLSASPDLQLAVARASGLFLPIGPPESCRFQWIHHIFRDFFLAESIYKRQPKDLDRYNGVDLPFLGDFLGMMVQDRCRRGSALARRLAEAALRLGVTPVQDRVGCILVEHTRTNIQLVEESFSTASRSQSVAPDGTSRFDMYLYRIGMLGDLERIQELCRAWPAFKVKNDFFLDGVAEGGHLSVLEWLCLEQGVSGDDLLDAGVYACDNRSVLDFIFRLPNADPLWFFVHGDPKSGQLLFMQMVLEFCNPSGEAILEALRVWTEEVLLEHDEETLAIRQLLSAALRRFI